MNTPKCPLCGGKMKRHGKTSAGSQRWQCMSCMASTTHKINNDAKLLKEFLDWLLSKDLQIDMPGQGRTFRRKTTKFWHIWPMPPLVDEIFKVIYVDGIYLTRTTVVLIARSDRYVLGWYLARSENARAYEALLGRIAAPEMVVSDGGSGFEKARRKVWKDTKVQRCTFHAFCQVKKYTTSRPKLEAGVELYAIAKDLLHIKRIKEAEKWAESYSSWCFKWADFLAEQSLIDGHYVLTHERLVKARNSLNTLVNKGTLFTFLDPLLIEDSPLPATNNKIEGGVNAPLRQMLRDHRGMSLMRRIKAVFWWCYMHTECPLSPASLLKVMPTDESIEGIYRSISVQQRLQETIPQWGDAVVWHELHSAAPYRMDWD